MDNSPTPITKKAPPRATPIIARVRSVAEPLVTCDPHPQKALHGRHKALGWRGAMGENGKSKVPQKRGMIDTGKWLHKLHAGTL